jgi:hypothetical protein
MSWLKFDTSTPEKPEVLAITVELGWDDPDLTVGKLLKVWRWFDLHSIDGNAPSVTLQLLDRIIGVTGITQAMLNVGWLEHLEGGGLSISNFENHNGTTAKDRALAAKRAAAHRGKVGSNDKSVTNALPREEKRREEKNIEPNGSKSTYPPEFEQAWEAYPRKAGGSKKDAHKAWAARLKAGATAEGIADGVARYAAYCKAEGTEERFIKQAVTFFGVGDHYLADWTPTKRQASKTYHDLSKMDYAKGVNADGSF